MSSSPLLSPQGMERVVLSDFPPPDSNNSAPAGLNFRQFVDALARCGLIAFSSKRSSSRTRRAPTVGGGVARDGSGGGTQKNNEQFVSAGERAHAMFIGHMRLLDAQHVDARLEQLVVHLHPPANSEGDYNATTMKGEKYGNGTSKQSSRGRAAASGGGGGGDKTKKGSLQKTRVTTANNPARLRGGSRNKASAAAADLKPISSLAPIQATTSRGKKP